jgi:hypothetical protein
MAAEELRFTVHHVDPAMRRDLDREFKIRAARATTCPPVAPLKGPGMQREGEPSTVRPTIDQPSDQVESRDLLWRHRECETGEVTGPHVRLRIACVHP